MFDWLFEGQFTVYLLLGFAVLTCLALWVRGRKNGFAIAAGVGGLLLLAYFLLDRFVETKQEQITRKVQEMARAVERQDLERILSHVSPSFRFQNRNKEGFRAYCLEVMRKGLARRLEVWDFNFSGGPSKPRFRAKLDSPRLVEVNQFIVEADFVQDDDGQWRLRGFELFNPLVESQTPIQIPPLP